MLYNVTIYVTTEQLEFTIFDISALDLGTAIAKAIRTLENSGFSLSEMKVLRYTCFCN